MEKSLKRQNSDLKWKAALYTVGPVLIYIISYLMFYKQTLLPKNSDIVAHMKHALSLDLVLELSHCGWHLACWILYACLPISINVAAAAVSALFNSLAAMVVIWLCEKYISDRIPEIRIRFWITTGVMLTALMVGPLYLRFYNDKYYLGQGSPNVWHNPTTTGVRPFALVMTVMTVAYWSCGEDETVTFGGRTWKKNTAYQLVMMVLLFISTIIKPSYIMVYLPVCGIVALVKLVESRGRMFGKLICQHLYFIPSLAAFLWQYIKIYVMGGLSGDPSDTGIEIALFKVARRYASSVTVSLLLKMAFPFLIIILWRKVIVKDKVFQLLFWQFLVGLAITWTLAEKGKRAYHGNMGWGNILAASLLWIFCIIFYVREMAGDREKLLSDAKTRVKYAVPGVLLIWHLLGGICYYLNVIQNMSGQL